MQGISADLVDAAVVNEEREIKGVLILGNIRPGFEEHASHDDSDFFGVKELINLQFLPLQHKVPA